MASAHVYLGQCRLAACKLCLRKSDSRREMLQRAISCINIRVCLGSGPRNGLGVGFGSGLGIGLGICLGVCLDMGRALAPWVVICVD